MFCFVNIVLNNLCVKYQFLKATPARSVPLYHFDTLEPSPRITHHQMKVR